jgi:hypothetical protein
VVHFHSCLIHRRSSTQEEVQGFACCRICPDHSERERRDVMAKRPFKWAYGVTTVPERRGELLHRTLASLHSGGFESPRLFVDGWEDRYSSDYASLLLPVTVREPKIRAYGNWILALAELYIREPLADRYAIFQDDLVAVRNLRQYLEHVPYPPKSYLNLYTYKNFRDQRGPSNEDIVRGQPVGFLRSNGHGRGALALVFDLAATKVLLSSRHMVGRPSDPSVGWKKIDGGVVESLRNEGIVEWIHAPSLVQHIGETSTVGNPPHRQALTFPGENFDALIWLEKGAAAGCGKCP